jgi:hypothetical protein
VGGVRSTITGPFPNIESQVKLYSQLLGGYLFSPCGPPMTVDKYWMIYYGGHDFCQSGGSQEYDNWATTQLNVMYRAIHSNGSSLDWGKVLTPGVVNFGN